MNPTYDLAVLEGEARAYRVPPLTQEQGWENQKLTESTYWYIIMHMLSECHEHDMEYDRKYNTYQGLITGKLKVSMGPFEAGQVVEIGIVDDKVDFYQVNEEGAVIEEFRCILKIESKHTIVPV